MHFNEPLPVFNPCTSQSNTGIFQRPRLSIQETEIEKVMILLYRLIESGKQKFIALLYLTNIVIIIQDFGNLQIQIFKELFFLIKKRLKLKIKCKS